MADVQIDDGDFTRIANEILENIARAKLNGTQYAIVVTVWRYTYGYQRTEAEFSLGFLEKKTGIHRNQIQRELIKLIDRKILIVTKEHTETTPQILKFNKDYDRWVSTKTLIPISENANTPPIKLRTSKGKQGVSTKTLTGGGISEKVDRGVSELVDHIKKDIKKESNKRLSSTTPYEEIKNEFNCICVSYSKVTELSDSRKKNINARWKQLKTMDKFREIFTITENTPFLKGENDRNWKTSFDWLMGNDRNCLKVLEGQYNRVRAPTKKQKAKGESYDDIIFGNSRGSPSEES